MSPKGDSFSSVQDTVIIYQINSPNIHTYNQYTYAQKNDGSIIPKYNLACTTCIVMKIIQRTNGNLPQGNPFLKSECKDRRFLINMQAIQTIIFKKNTKFLINT